MRTITTFLKTKLFLAFSILLAAVFFYSSCNKKDDNNAPAPACNDGIQNQGETGIDCGGPCPACQSMLCNGNGQNQYFPLLSGNYWKYEDRGVSGARYSLTINGTLAFGSNTYNVVEYCDLPPSCSATDNYYMRTATNGDVYQYIDSAEYLLIPANPVVNQTWAFPVSTGIGSRKVMSTNETVSTYDCSYTGCLKIQEFTSGNAPWKIYHYKKGIGLVFENAGTANHRLVETTLH